MRGIIAFVLALSITAIAAVASGSAIDEAKAALAAKDNVTAIRLATAALDVSNISKVDIAMLRVVRGQAYLLAEEYDAAIADFTAAIDVPATPKDTCAALGNIFIFRGDAYQGLRRFRDAAEDFKRAVVCEPENAVVRFKLGTAYFYFDRTNAVDALSEAIKLKPGYLEALMERAKNYENMQDFDKALADYGEILRIDPNNAGAYHNRATIYSALGRVDDALADCDKAIALDPANPLSFLNRAYLHFFKKDIKAARADLDRAKALYDDPVLNQKFRKMFGPVFSKQIEWELAQLDDDLTNASAQ